MTNKQIKIIILSSIYIIYCPALFGKDFSDRYFFDSYPLWQIDTNNLIVYSESDTDSTPDNWLGLKNKLLDIRKSIIRLNATEVQLPTAITIECEGRLINFPEQTRVKGYQLSVNRYLYVYDDKFSCEYDRPKLVNLIPSVFNSSDSSWWLQIEHTSEFKSGWIEVSQYLNRSRRSIVKLIGSLAINPKSITSKWPLSGIYNDGIYINSQPGRIRGAIYYQQHFNATRKEFLKKCIFYFYSKDQQDEETNIIDINYIKIGEDEYKEGKLKTSWQKFTPNVVIQLEENNSECQKFDFNTRPTSFSLISRYDNFNIAIAKYNNLPIYSQTNQILACIEQFHPIFVFNNQDTSTLVLSDWHKNIRGNTQIENIFTEQEFMNLPQLINDLTFNDLPLINGINSCP